MSCTGTCSGVVLSWKIYLITWGLHLPKTQLNAFKDTCYTCKKNTVKIFNTYNVSKNPRYGVHWTLFESVCGKTWLHKKEDELGHIHVRADRFSYSHTSEDLHRLHLGFPPHCDSQYRWPVTCKSPCLGSYTLPSKKTQHLIQVPKQPQLRVSDPKGWKSY